MGRPKGAKNRRTIVKQAEDAMGVVAPDVDTLHVMEQTMRHFYTRAMVLKQTKGPKEQIDADLKDAAMMAEKLAPYRHARLSAVKLAGDPNNPVRFSDDASIEELRAEVLKHLERLAPVLDLPALEVRPTGIAAAGDQSE